MDTALLTTRAFWEDPTPFAAGSFPGEIPACEELLEHVLFETSGSSGTPKWIALSKDALLASAAAVNAHLDVSASSCWGLALPARHVGGFGVAARAFAAGCAFREFGGRWDAAGFTQWLGENHVTHTSLVPAQVHDLVSAGLRAPASLRAIVVGGGRMETETGNAARTLGWPVLASYGMTEAASQIATQGLASLGEIYQPAPIPVLPVWNVEACEDQRLRINGPALFSGVLVRESSGWVFKKRTEEWHQTEDRVILANGCITPLGRADTQVKVLGELVDLSAIELELAHLSGGRLAPGSFAVVARPDARAEHVLVPVFDASVEPHVIAAVLAAHAENAPGFKRLRDAVVLEDFPKSPLGKPRRKDIAERIRPTS